MRRIQIRGVLDALGVYDSTKPLLDAEISAYEAGIGMFLAEFDRIRADLFLETATEEGLRKRESQFRKVGADVDAEGLRAQLSEREKIRGCFKEGLQSRLAACGIRGEIEENHQGGVLIRAEALEGVGEEQALRETEAFLPAHLPCALSLS